MKKLLLLLALIFPIAANAAVTVDQVVVTSAYQVAVPQPDILYIFANASGGAFTVTLPSTTSMRANQAIYIIKTDSSGNAVTVSTTNTSNMLAPTINGSSTDSLASQYSAGRYVPNSILKQWFKF